MNDTDNAFVRARFRIHCSTPPKQVSAKFTKWRCSGNVRKMQRAAGQHEDLVTQRNGMQTDEILEEKRKIIKTIASEAIWKKLRRLRNEKKMGFTKSSNISHSKKKPASWRARNTADCRVRPRTPVGWIIKKTL